MNLDQHRSDAAALWEWAAGSVIGRDHRVLGRNCQDAWRVRTAGPVWVGVVADGCGAAPHSEVGARLLADLVSGALLARGDAIAAGEGAAAAAGAVTEALGELAHLAGSMREAGGAAVRDLLLATVVAAAVTVERTIVVRWGDGVTARNGVVTVHTSTDNAPDYPAYALLGPRHPRGRQDGTAPVVEWEGPSTAVRSLVLATDGAVDLLRAATQPIPGALEAVGDLDAWLANDHLFRQPVALSRRLGRIARDHHAIDWDSRVVRRAPGLLRDDTTLILLRPAAREDAATGDGVAGMEGPCGSA